MHSNYIYKFKARLGLMASGSISGFEASAASSMSFFKVEGIIHKWERAWGREYQTGALWFRLANAGAGCGQGAVTNLKIVSSSMSPESCEWTRIVKLQAPISGSWTSAVHIHFGGFITLPANRFLVDRFAQDEAHIFGRGGQLLSREFLWPQLEPKTAISFYTKRTFVREG